MRPEVPENSKTANQTSPEPPRFDPTKSEPCQPPQNPPNNSRSNTPPAQAAAVPVQRISNASAEHRARGWAIKLDRGRAVQLLSKIDEILAWEERFAQERDARFVELGRYLCEVREGQYYRVNNLKSFEKFLEKKFPQSRRKAYHLMAIYERLPRQIHRDLGQVGWSKAVDLAKVARHQGQHFNSETWFHKAKRMPKEEFKREVRKLLTGKDAEPCDIIYFTVRKSQLAAIEQALETASLVLSGHNSRGDCLEFICAAIHLANRLWLFQ